MEGMLMKIFDTLLLNSPSAAILVVWIVYIMYEKKLLDKRIAEKELQYAADLKQRDEKFLELLKSYEETLRKVTSALRKHQPFDEER